MKILVVNLELRPAPARKWVPLGLGYITSAMKRAGYEFDILDLDAHPQPPEQTEKFLRTHQYDIVAMGCIVTGYRFVKWISETVREAFPDTMIIVGNTVAQSITEIILTKTATDIAVIGEGDITIVELLDRLQTSRDLDGILGIWYQSENGEIMVNPPRPVIKNVDEIPTPNWEAWDVEFYIKDQSANANEPRPPIPPDQLRTFPLNTARGCPYTCTFCYHTFIDIKYRYRSSEAIVEEMRHYNNLYGINHFVFNDELTFFSPKQAEGFADTMLVSGLEVYWEADCRSGLFSKDEHVEIARKLKRAGCLSLSFALESANPDILKWMTKRVGPVNFSRQVEILRQAGLASLTSIVIGYPNETPETIKETIDVCIANRIYPSAGYLLPQPGTPMYTYALEHGYIKEEEDYLMMMGDRQDLLLNMTQMSDEELIEVTENELERCSRELKLGLAGEKLLKTGFYRSPEQSKDMVSAETEVIPLYSS